MTTPRTTSTRQRLAPDARYGQLLAAAGELFAAVPYDEAQIEHIAAKAGVSASLIYHYFPNKKSLFAAVVDQAVDELGRVTDAPEDLPPVERFRAAIAGYVDFIETHEHAYRAMHRGREAGNAQVQAAIERNTQTQIDRIIASLSPHEPASPKLVMGARAALGLIIAMCLDWLQNRQVERSALQEMLVGAVFGAVSGAVAPEATAAGAIGFLLGDGTATTPSKRN